MMVNTDHTELRQCDTSNKCVEWCRRNIATQDNRDSCNGYHAYYYSNFLSGTINNQLRSNAITNECSQVVDELNLYLEQVSEAKTKHVYRGLRNFNPFEGMEEGDCFQDRAFLSTTTSEKIALKFSNKYGAIMEIKHFSGKDIPSALPREKEILLKNNTILQLTGKYEKRVKKRKAYKRYKLKEITDISLCQNLKH
jgi:hypothetical protein